MSASGFTPIQLYRSTTAAAVPTAGNLVAGELAINLTDEKLYFENASGVVKVLADSTYVGTVTSVNASGGTTGMTFSGGPITSSGTLTLAGTLAVANGGTGTATAFTAGSVVFAGASGVYSQDNANLFWDNTNDRLGIGTATPTQRLHVRQDQDGTTSALIQNRNGSGTPVSAVQFISGAFDLSDNRYAMISSAGGSNTTLQFWTGSGATPTERMRVTDTGNVGIGTTSPGYKLDVNGTGYFNSSVQFFPQDGFRFTSASAVSAMRFGSATAGESTAQWAYDRAAGTTTLSVGNTGSALNERMRIDSSGNVMVGTTSATGLFSVAGVSYGQMIATDRFGILGNNLYFGGGGGGDFRYIGNGHAYGWTQGNTDGADYRLLYAGNNTSGAGAVATTSERIYITAAGNVGIGTSSPAVKLDVIGAIYSRPGEAAGAVAELTADASSGANGISLIAGFTSGGYGPIKLLTSATERMRIDTSGNVGIGTTGGDFGRSWRLVARQDQNAITNIGVINANTGASASAQISKITGTGNSFVDWGLVDNSGSPYDAFSYGSAVQYVSWGFGGSERMRIASNGFVGVGTSSDNGIDKLTVAGIVGSYISGRAGFHLYNGGATAEWFIGQPSGASHNLTFSKLVAGTYTDYVAIDSSGNVGIGNTSPTVTLDVTGGIKTSRTAVTSPATSDGNIFSGTYTPTLTNSTNVDISNSTAYACQYMRVGDVITVSGKVSIAVIGTGITRLNMTLPVASNFSADENCAGTAQVSYAGVSTNLAAQVKADFSNDRAQILYFGNVTGAAQDFYFTFTYRVI
jgi:hypothetical protein